MDVLKTPSQAVRDNRDVPSGSTGGASGSTGGASGSTGGASGGTGASVPAAPSPYELHRQVMGEIVSGVQTNPADTQKAQLRSEILEYISVHATQKDPAKGFPPGTFSTGFAHILTTKNRDAVVPLDATPLDGEAMEAEKRKIIAAALEYFNNPSVAPPCDTFTLDELVRGRAPTAVKQAFGFHIDAPALGKDSYNNHVYILPHAHPSFAAIAQLIQKNSDRDTVQPAQDEWTWARTAWMATLISTDPNKLRTTLQGHLGDAHKTQIDQIVKMAEDAQSSKAVDGKSPSAGILAISKDTDDCNGKSLGLKLNAPSSVDAAGPSSDVDNEATLKELTNALLKGVNHVNGTPLLATDEPAGTAHLLALMNKLDSVAVVFNKNVQPEMNNWIISANPKPDFLTAERQSLEQKDPQNPFSNFAFAAKGIGYLPTIVHENGGYKLQLSSPKLKTDVDNELVAVKEEERLAQAKLQAAPVTGGPREPEDNIIAADGRNYVSGIQTHGLRDWAAANPYKY